MTLTALVGVKEHTLLTETGLERINVDFNIFEKFITDLVVAGAVDMAQAQRRGSDRVMPSL